jgi:hypothetical protein
MTWQRWPLTTLLVLFVGVVGLVSDYLRWPHYRILNIHLLFGGMLLTSVVRALLREWHASRCNCDSHYYLFTRCLARGVYVLLYLMAALRLCLYIAAGRGAATKDLISDFVARQHSLEDFQIYIAYAAAVVFLIRIFAVVHARKRIRNRRLSLAARR